MGSMGISLVSKCLLLVFNNTISELVASFLKCCNKDVTLQKKCISQTNV